LNEDGISITDGRIKDFDQVFFNDFDSEYPLKSCRKEQQELSRKIIIADSISEKNIEIVAGFDVAYSYDDDWKESCGACVIIDVKTKKIIEQKVVFKKTRFPYIPTYLSFREKPFIEDLFKQLEHKPSVLFVDGNGILHPRRFGLASHIGVSLDIPTIGVAKNLLCGKRQPDNTIVYKNQILGHAFYANPRVKKPVYISPGHKISLETAVKLVQEMSTYKQPEPLRQAHLLATSSFRQYHENHC
jgi:deoxyribonuclease V